VIGDLPTAPDGRRAAIMRKHDLPMRQFPTEAGFATFREPIDKNTDCRELVQRVIRLWPEARTAQMTNEECEDILYVAEGSVSVTAGDDRFELGRASALLVPQACDYGLASGDAQALVVSVLSPPPGSDAASGSGEELAVEAGAAVAATHEDEQEALTAGQDRWFKVLIDPRFGSRRVTQFIGFIERGRAPAHTHTYEEVIYILGGTGMVHVDERRVPISSGTSIFLPPGVSHCLENTGESPLKLLGVFSPPGAPASKQED
jgi:mannose-6-phosphate isomerase-like protein (cupin superfamily)